MAGVPGAPLGWASVELAATIRKDHLTPPAALAPAGGLLLLDPWAPLSKRLAPPSSGRMGRAAELLDSLVLSGDFVPFLTGGAYGYLEQDNK